MSELRAVASMCDDERKAFSSKGAYLSVTHTQGVQHMSNDEQRRTQDELERGERKTLASESHRDER